MARSTRIELVARNVLFERKLATLTAAELATMLAALTPSQLNALLALVRTGDLERLGKTVAFYIRNGLQQAADAEAAAMASKDALTQTEVESLLKQP